MGCGKIYQKDLSGFEKSGSRDPVWGAESRNIPSSPLHQKRGRSSLICWACSSSVDCQLCIYFSIAVLQPFREYHSTSLKVQNTACYPLHQATSCVGKLTWEILTYVFSSYQACIEILGDAMVFALVFTSLRCHMQELKL